MPLIKNIMKIQVAQLSHIGMHRSENQDSLAFVSPQEKPVLDSRGCLLVVADGMGGAAGGRMASQLAVTAISEIYFQENHEPLESLKSAIEQANSRIFERAQSETNLNGMGTTVTAVIFVDGRYVSGHVGDTRLYRLRSANLQRLTSDHSMVAQMVRDGILSEKEARRHPQRNILLRSVGIHPNITMDLQSDQIQAGDLYLLCTDGLHGLVEDEEIASVLSHGSPDEACTALVDLANSRGGYDNISVLVAKIQEDV
ncbi:MAG: Stp1/IreP family PP2C-type Ser/Thr phosphatase [Acidobacteriia bacterium]|nr:Stp1/IreP family PP2C-type Ser/Thr phosphatase [Terriglobia bacterium]